MEVASEEFRVIEFTCEEFNAMDGCLAQFKVVEGGFDERALQCGNAGFACIR